MANDPMPQTESSQKTQEEEEEDAAPKYPTPDLSQMLPFKPKTVVRKSKNYIIMF